MDHAADIRLPSATRRHGHRSGRVGRQRDGRQSGSSADRVRPGDDRAACRTGGRPAPHPPPSLTGLATADICRATRRQTPARGRWATPHARPCDRCRVVGWAMPKAGGARRVRPKRARHRVRRAVGRNARVNSERVASVRTVGTGRRWQSLGGPNQWASGVWADGRPIPAVLRTMRQSDRPGRAPLADRAVDVPVLRRVRMRPLLDPCGRGVPRVWHLGRRCKVSGRCGCLGLGACRRRCNSRRRCACRRRCGPGERLGRRGCRRDERRRIARAAQGLARADRVRRGRCGGSRRFSARVHDRRSVPTGRRARAGVGDAGRRHERDPPQWPVPALVVRRRRRPHVIGGRVLAGPVRGIAGPGRHSGPALRHGRARAHAGPDACANGRARTHTSAHATTDANAHATPHASADRAPDTLRAAGATARRGAQVRRGGHLERGWLHGSGRCATWRWQLPDRHAGPGRGADIPMRCLGHGRACRSKLSRGDRPRASAVGVTFVAVNKPEGRR